MLSDNVQNCTLMWLRMAATYTLNVNKNTFPKYDGWSFAENCLGTYLQYHYFILLGTLFELL